MDLFGAEMEKDRDMEMMKTAEEPCEGFEPEFDVTPSAVPMQEEPMAEPMPEPVPLSTPQPVCEESIVMSDAPQPCGEAVLDMEPPVPLIEKVGVNLKCYYGLGLKNFKHLLFKTWHVRFWNICNI